MIDRFAVLLAALALLFPSARAADEIEPVDNAAGQRIYVPVYSHIYQRSATGKTPLAATLSIRNTDEDDPVTVSLVDYYDSDGKRVKGLIQEPRVLGPLATIEFVIAERDDAGGAGANFIVVWTAARPVSAPIVETVMIGVLGNQSFSFKGDGKVLAETRR